MANHPKAPFTLWVLRLLKPLHTYETYEPLIVEGWLLADKSKFVVQQDPRRAVVVALALVLTFSLTANCTLTPMPEDFSQMLARSLAVQAHDEEENPEEEWVFPLSSYKQVTTRFGQGGHNGVDITSWAGTPIITCHSGTVVTAAYHSSYGNYVLIDHGVDSEGHQWHTLYAHMSRLYVRVGDELTPGVTVGAVGNTGFSMGNHLHLELYRDGVRQNPINYIPFPGF